MIGRFKISLNNMCNLLLAQYEFMIGYIYIWYICIYMCIWYAYMYDIYVYINDSWEASSSNVWNVLLFVLLFALQWNQKPQNTHPLRIIKIWWYCFERNISALWHHGGPTKGTIVLRTLRGALYWSLIMPRDHRFWDSGCNFLE